MSESNPSKYSLSRLILCEGSVDVAFVKALVRERRLRRCHVKHSGNRRNGRGGKSKFSDALRAARVNPSFRRTVKEILILTDSDDDHGASFAEVVEQIERAGFDAPNAPRAWTNGSPRIAVFLVPPDLPGALEAYIKDASRATDPNLAAFVDHFVDHACAGWDEVKKSKLWFRAFISARNRIDPSASSWRITEGNDPEVVRMADVSLNGLAQFLS